MKIKTWLEHKLKIPELKEEMSLLRKRIDSLERELHTTENRIKALEDLVQVGVDINIYGESWAVVCINGKPEYVNFIRIRDDEAHKIFRFFKSFEKKCIDAPHGMRWSEW